MKYYFLLSLICLTKCEIQKLISGGEIGKIKQFPHTGSLRVMCHKKQNVGWTCGSSIVNQRILLTAGHCVDSCSRGNKLSVSTGHRRKGHGVMSSIHSIFLHEKYTKYGISYDIALLRLKTDLKFSSKVRRVALMKNPPYYEKAQVAGWGFNKDILHYIDQYVWKNSKCRQTTKIGRGTLCVSSKRKKSYATAGDSGSALVVRGYIQIGLVSYKMPEISKSLVVYTDTGYFYNWIKKNSKKLYCVIEKA